MTKTGRLDLNKFRKNLNKGRDVEVAVDPNSLNLKEVREWIPTGSRWLDGMINKGSLGGIPVGRITELAGLESSGKSFIAAQAIGHAQKMGFTCVLFDTERTMSPDFLEKCGVDTGPDSLLIVHPAHAEDMFEIVDQLMAEGTRFFFVWDSLAATPTKAQVEGSFDPNKNTAVLARVASVAMKKLTNPLADSDSAFLILNQLRHNVNHSNPVEMLINPFYTPGGKALIFHYSLRIWLTRRKGKSHHVNDDKGYRIGSTLKCELKKSKFGTEGRQCGFQIIWGDDNRVGVRDEESWFEAILNSDKIASAGAWWTLTNDSYEKKFQKKDWLNLIETDPVFKENVLQIFDEEVIQKFKDKTGNAKNFFDIDDEQPATEEEGDG